MIKKNVTINWGGVFDMPDIPVKKWNRRYTFSEMNQYVDDDTWDENMGELISHYINIYGSVMTKRKLEKLRRKSLGDLKDYDKDNK